MGFEDNDVRFKTSRYDFLSLVDGFIDRAFQIRKTLLRVSLSAVILAPLSIALSTFLLFHPSFFAVLEIENEFGLVLSLLLGAVIIISSIWLITVWFISARLIIAPLFLLVLLLLSCL
jgi:hypothetical protein